MTLSKAAFALTGKTTNLTGGTLYDRRVIEELRRAGTDVAYIELPSGFPSPSDTDMYDAIKALGAMPQYAPLIVDGLAFGAMYGLETFTAPLYQLIHHPLAEEIGLADHIRHRLFKTERRNRSNASHILVPSALTKALLINGNDVAPSDITIARPRTDRPSLVQAPDVPLLILAVGVPVPRKGHDVLLRALSQFLDLGWTAIIVGKVLDSHYPKSSIKLTAAYGLAGRVKGEPVHFRRTVSLSALASRYEGYGIIDDDALARGLPIVANGAGAIVDTVPQDAGIVVPPVDPQAFADAIYQMLRTPSIMGTKAKAALRAGQALPSWAQTAARIAFTLNRQGIPCNLI